MLKNSSLTLLAALSLPLAACSEEQLNPVRTGWSQWGQNAEHTGQVSVEGQDLRRILAEVLMDPFVHHERSEAGYYEHGVGPLLIHYQAPLVGEDDVFISSKGGTYVPCVPPASGEPFPCGVNAWDQQTWREERHRWIGDELVHSWTFESDWKPIPSLYGAFTWEPVFHAALAGEHVVVPGGDGGIWVVDRETGESVRKIEPFFDAFNNDPLNPPPPEERFVAGPLTVDSNGNIYYHAIVYGNRPVDNGTIIDVMSGWLIKARTDGSFEKVNFQELVLDAPKPDAECPGGFRLDMDALPWPPSPNAKPLNIRCGVQRPGVNVAPAVAPDGTLYTVSRSDNASRVSYVVAVNPDLTPKWASSLQNRLMDGCGTLTLPPDGQPGGCRPGAPVGVDPATNGPPAGIVSDQSTSSPVVTPEGSVIYSAYSRYNYSRGHLFHFNQDGSLRGTFDFGWDVTPGIYARPGGYSIIIKENQYNTGSYCNNRDFCPPLAGGPFNLTQLSPDLEVEWSFTLTNTKSCVRLENGERSCVSDHPTGFEWCINAPAIDQNGVVYGNGEDGVLYAIEQGGRSVQTIFLGEALGAAYTPLAIDRKGRIYTENVGKLFVVGE
jgi:outer membrane protein assembly factor BamB